MNIDDLTIGEARKLAEMFGQAKSSNSHSLKVGEKYFIRTVTMFFTGMVIAVTDSDIELSDAAWIADTRQFSEFLKNGPSKDAEIEPYPHGVIVNRGSIIDCSVWVHNLPKVKQ